MSSYLYENGVLGGVKRWGRGHLVRVLSKENPLEALIIGDLTRGMGGPEAGYREKWSWGWYAENYNENLKTPWPTLAPGPQNCPSLVLKNFKKGHRSVLSI